MARIYATNLRDATLVRIGISQLRGLDTQKISCFPVPVVIPFFHDRLCAEGARAGAKVPAEGSAEMSGIAEAPKKSNLGDRFVGQA